MRPAPQVRTQLKRQNRKRCAETQAYKQRDLFGRPDGAVPALDGHPRSQNEIQREDADEHIDPLIGHHETEIAAEHRHDHHRNDEHRARFAVQSAAFARDHRDRAGHEADRAAADVQSEDEERQGMQRACSKSESCVNGAEQLVPVHR